jgi:NAD(P)-dependent dehydrogenase (short-subunit alcohol dehydrogenase family)
MPAQPVALVTGGSRGIGRGICVELARAGYAIAINYAGNEQAAHETETLLGAGAVSMLCRGDVSVAADRDRMVDDVLGLWGRIDLLVNNAGITSVGRLDLLEATEESWDRVLGVNLKGPFFLSQRVAREMLSASTPCATRRSSTSRVCRLQRLDQPRRLLHLQDRPGHADAVVRPAAGRGRHPRL